MFNLQKELFKENHLSYYNEVDIQTLKECKTIVPVGRFYKDASAEASRGSQARVIPMKKIKRN